VNGRELHDAASEASHAVYLKDLVGSFNAKSALTVGDLCHWCFPGRQSMCLFHTGFDIRAGIKANGFDFYAINCKSYGSPINRPQPPNNLLSRLFSFSSMRSEGPQLDCLSSPSRACVLMNNKNSKLSCFPSIFSEDYHCQVISKSKSITLSAFTAVP